MGSRSGGDATIETVESWDVVFTDRDCLLSKCAGVASLKSKTGKAVMAEVVVHVGCRPIGIKNFIITFSPRCWTAMGFCIS